MKSFKIFQHEMGLLWRSVSTLYILFLAWALVYGLTFFWGQFLINNRADFNVFFSFHPWIYLFLAPAVAMFGWPEEHRNGTTQQLMRFPVGVGRLFVTKLAAQLTVVLAFLLGSLPLLATVMWLGTPDINLYFSGLIASFLLGVLACASANALAVWTKRPLIAWVLGVAAAASATFGMTALGLPLLNNYRLAVEGYLSLPILGLTLGLIVMFCAVGAARLAVWLRRAYAQPLVLGLVTILCVGAATFLNVWQQHIGLDVSQEKHHTLHPASIKYVKNLTEPIDLTLYAPQKLQGVPPVLRQHIQRVQATVARLTRYNTQLNLIVVDPMASAKNEQQAIQAGVLPLATQQGRPLLFGLTAQKKEKTALIAQFHPSQVAQTEFSIMSALIDVQQTKTPQIGLMTELNLGRENAKRPQFLQALVNKYDVQRVSPYEPVIPASTDLLIVFQTPTMSIESVYALDQYLVNGGKAIILLDPFFRTAPSADFLAPDRNADNVALDHPADILRHYGIEYNYKEVAADNSLAAAIDLEGVGRTRYPLWLNLSSDNINPEHPITATISQLLWVESGAFELQKLQQNLTLTPLLNTGKLGQIALRSDLLSENPQSIASKLRGDKKQRMLAFNLTGMFGSLYPTTPSKVVEYYTNFTLEEAELKIPPHIKTSQKLGEIVVFGDIDFLSDEYAIGQQKTEIVAPNNQNIALMFNAVQYLLGEDVLLPLRTKANITRSFTRLETLFANVAAGFQELEARIGSQLLQTDANIKELNTEVGDKTPTEAQVTEQQALGIQKIELQRQLAQVQGGIGGVVQQVGYSIMALNFLSPPLVAWLVWLCYIWRRNKRMKKTK